MRSLAFIPARSGSKGLPDKNILPLCGKPMIAYTIEAAKESGCFDYIFVSTDSEKYAAIAREYGAEAPFLRSEEASADTAPTSLAILEALRELEKLGMKFDTICTLQPTSPLRTAEDIRKAFEQYKSRDAKTVISVCEMPHPPEWSFLLDEEGSMKDFAKSPYNMSRRQELPTHYIENGAIFLTVPETYLENQNIYEDRCYASIMSAQNSYDIDDAEDFQIAQAIMKEKK